ncbi:alginate export family protein [Aliiglaciecola sp. LCG003]|uniref:alginate export family protein n=1 Tax=Aliiglaciecola sp. LCG003 TaxID=3053655 RepID=UPI0025740DF6|nr:alginate export family protein [Aliiglaciecola sp. LCG003]WJG11116.1 alginate export family protein [Aliiglaciecola sp. LCG003]
MPVTSYQAGEYSVVSDPDFTALDQAFIRYANEKLDIKLGRQVITFENHRFLGHVGWQQVRQTFDGLTVNYAPVEQLAIKYAYLTKRRIFAQQTDLDAKDQVLNLSYSSSVGNLTAYSYLLEIKQQAKNKLDTYSLRFSGQQAVEQITLLYAFEYASQHNHTDISDYDAKYFFAETGLLFNGVTAKLAYEILGSDNGEFGFQTPLATLHKFNGCSDQFLMTPSQGLKDIYLSLSMPILGGTAVVVYHDFSADDGVTGAEDFASEVDLQFTRKFS